MMYFLFLLTIPTIILALNAAPQKANPVIFGTSDYSNILFGKLQRAASLFGTNLGEPLAVISENEGDSLRKLDKCLWDQFCMAYSGPAGTLEESDMLLPLTSWIPQGDLQGALIFIDAAKHLQKPEEEPGEALKKIFNLFMKKEEKEETTKESVTVPSRPINEKLLKVAAQRKCAHVYILADDESLSSCIASIEQYSIPCTILVLDSVLSFTPNWISSRPQDLEGELTAPLSLSKYDETSPSKINLSSTPHTFPAEDAAEVMVQVALRTKRDPSEHRIVRLSGGGDDTNPLDSRINSDYFSRTGSQQAGTVLSVSSWESVLGPSFGSILGDVGKRQDVSPS